MVLVTGGTGLVGSYLLLELLRKGAPIRATFREGSDLDRVRELLRWYDPEIAARWSEIQWNRAGVGDIPALEVAFEGIREVYHCAGLISFDPADRNALLKTNFEGTRNMVNLALDRGVSRFCYVSSIATIDGTSGTLIESNAWDPAHTNIYATSKYLAEMEVWRGIAEGLGACIVNPGVILGPGFYGSGGGRFFRAVAGGIGYYPPGGTGFVGVADVVRAMLELTARAQFGERFILVGENAAYGDLMSRIAVVLDREAPRKPLKKWQLEVLWRMDWLRARFTRKKRRLSRAVARSLGHPRHYSSSKLLEALNGFRFTPLDDVVGLCGRHYNETGQP